MVLGLKSARADPHEMRRHTNSSDISSLPPEDERERDEWILKEMYVPQAAQEKPAAEQDLVDLVFVHGLGGNLRSTWKIEGTHDPWFARKDFLGPLQDSVRVLSFGYNANRFDGVANTRIIHHANDLLRNIVLKRPDCPDRPIIFIAHSLGGLIVKRAILLCATNNNWSAIKTSTKAIVFMGTPHMGSDQAEHLVVVQKLASLIKFQAPIATHLSRELTTFSTSVQDINMEFTPDVHRSIELLCCYESHPQRLPSGSKEIIVPQWSAVLPGVENVDLLCTHSALPKFGTPTEPRFELFWGEVQRLVRKARTPPLRLIHAPTSWVDEEVAQPAPAKTQQQLAPRRRSEVVSKSPKPSRASLIRSSANEIIAEVRNRIIINAPEPESAASQLKPREQPQEEIDPKEFEIFLQLLRQITPENQGLDREQPHWKTCRWITTDPIFMDWMDDGGLLFITGNPGCGKSHLAKFIQGLLENPEEDETGETRESLVVSFYCDSLESSKGNPPILDLVVKAVLSRRKALFRSVQQKIHSVLHTEVQLRFNHLMEVLHTLFTDPKGVPTCLIVDGLDQCADDFVLSFLRGLETLFRRDSSSSKLRIVITSRLTDSIRGFALNSLHLDMTPAKVGEDIQHVVDEEVDRIFKARQITSIGRDSVSAVIVDRANGSFLFASSVLKELRSTKDTGANAVFTLLTSCPSTMEAMYQQDMSRLETERPDLFRLIRFMCIARRTLRMTEARDLLQMYNSEITSTYDVVGDLRRLCPRLVKYGAEDTVELLHQTLYDFIMSTYNADEIHGALADTCLRYLKKVDWPVAFESQEPMASNVSLPDELPMPLLDYAASWMGYHFRSAHEVAKASAWDIWDFFCSEDGNQWQRYCQPKKRRVRSVARSDSSFSRRSSMSMSIDSGDEEINSDDKKMSLDDNEKDFDQSHQTPLSRTNMEEKQKMEEEQKAESDAEDDEWETSQSSVSTTFPAAAPIGAPLKPPLVLLAQWDVEPVVRELFFEALESSPRQVLSMILGMVPFLPSRSPVKNQKEFRAMVNNIWEDTTAVHYAAAQSGSVLELLLPFMDDIDQTDDDGATLLMLAAASGESKGVEALLKAGADVNLVDRWSQTALYSALHTNNSGVIKMLLEHEADPDIPSSTGHSPLEVAVGQNNAEHAKILLEFKANTKLPMTTGQPPVFLANRIKAHAVMEELLPYVDVDQLWDGERLIHNVTWCGLESVVRKLIALGANLDDPPIDTPKATPVALAAETDNTVILRELLEAGAESECPAFGLSAPLHIAASRGYWEACRLLIEHGCNINAPSERDQTPLFIATEKQKVGVVELLVSNAANPRLPYYEPPLLVAADIGNLEMLKVILSGKVAPNVDARSARQDTALGITANYGDFEMVSVLLDHGADPNRRSGKRISNLPLQLAVAGRHPDVAIELLKRGAAPLPKRLAEQSAFHVTCCEGLMDVIETFFEVIDPSELVNLEWGWYGTPLLQAATGGHENVVRLLIERGADPNYKLASKATRGKSVLHAAAEGGKIEILDFILSVLKEPDLESSDDKGRTPLAYACVRGREEMVKHLLEKGAKTDIIMATGENMAYSAVDGGSLKVLEVLLEADPNLDVDLPRNDGRTPLMMAAQQDSPAMLEALLKREVDVNRVCKDGSFVLSEVIQSRRRATLEVLLEHKSLDLLQLDCFDRNALQIAQSAGTHQMPSMVLNAAGSPDIENELMEHEDMFGWNTYEYTKLTRTPRIPWERALKGIRANAQQLLDNFTERGPAWERLGKFLLQANARSFAQIAFWRSVELVETTPVYLEHMVPCRLCRENISTNRSTCITCCNTDLCAKCMGRYAGLGSRMWTCQQHDFYGVGFPRSVDPDVGSSRRSSISSNSSWVSSETSDSLERRGLSPIPEDETEEEHDGESIASILGGPSAPMAHSENGDVIGHASSLLKDDDETSDVEEHANGDEPTVIQETDLILKRRDEPDDDEESLAGSTSDLDFTVRTEEELRKYLDVVLHAFPEGGNQDECLGWRFVPRAWTGIYRKPERLSLRRLDTPVVGALDLAQYNKLSCVPYLILKEDLQLVKTGLPFKVYHERASRRFFGVEDEAKAVEVKKGRRRALVKRDSSRTID